MFLPGILHETTQGLPQVNTWSNEKKPGSFASKPDSACSHTPFALDNRTQQLSFALEQIHVDVLPSDGSPG